MGFNFTEEDLRNASSNDSGPIFNNGQAGRAKNVTVTMEEAGVDGVPENTNENAPRFKVYFSDENGGRVNKGCFDIKPEDYPNQWGKTYEDTIKKEWAYLNKIVEHTGGKKVMSFTDDTDLFRKVKAAIGPNKVNVFVNYGTRSYPKAYLEPRKWLPAVEPAITPDEQTGLKPSNLDAMEALTEDKKETTNEGWI